MDNNQTIIDRLNSFLENNGVTRSQFADECGIPRPTVSQMLSGKNKKIGNDVISLIHKTYPDLPVDWLLFGEGDAPLKNNLDFKPSENSIFDLNSDNRSGNEMSQKSQESAPLNNIVPIRQKEISKILVFYSDNSFDEFILKR